MNVQNKRGEIELKIFINKNNEQKNSDKKCRQPGSESSKEARQRQEKKNKIK